MPRAYTVGTAALALDVPTKWVDNLLSHFPVPGVTQAHQGIARKVSLEALVQLTIALTLIRELSIPIAAALRLASEIVANSGIYEAPGRVTLKLDLARTQIDLERRLIAAVEMAPAPRRGRPPTRKTGRLD